MVRTKPRPLKKKRQHKTKYDEAVMKRVLERVQSGEWTVRHAAEMSGIPRATLGDRINKRHEKVDGRPGLLDAEEETLLVWHLQNMAAMDRPRTRIEFMDDVRNFLRKDKKRRDALGDGPSKILYDKVGKKISKSSWKKNFII